jgi:hypothetical protein
MFNMAADWQFFSTLRAFDAANDREMLIVKFY